MLIVQVSYLSLPEQQYRIWVSRQLSPIFTKMNIEIINKPFTLNLHGLSGGNKTGDGTFDVFEVMPKDPKGCLRGLRVCGERPENWKCHYQNGRLNLRL
jgi:hypothetical protein